MPALWLTLAAGLLPGCRAEQEPRPLRVAVDNVPSEIDPRFGLDQGAGRVADLMLDGLLTLTPDGELAPGLAESWEVLDDGRRYRFRLRDDVRFHDGRSLTAKDVVWTFGSVLRPEGGSPKRWSLGPVEKVLADGDRVVEFRLSEPHGVLPVNLTSSMGIVPRGVERPQFNRTPVGTGPFKLVQQSPTLLTFERFDGYWGGAAALAGIELREYRSARLREQALLDGDVDLVVGDLAPPAVSRFKGQRERFRVVQEPGSKHLYLVFNLEDPVLSDPRVRRAIGMAIDRQELAATVWQGQVEVCDGVLAKGHWARHDGLEPLPYDHQRARDLLDEAGWPDPGVGRPRLELTYKTSDDATYLAQAQEIRSMLEVVGVELEIEPSGFPTFLQEIEAGSFQLFGLTLLGIVDPDIYRLILHSESLPPEGLNRGRYREPEFDAAVEAGARGVERDVRRPHYHEAQELIARDLPWLSLFAKHNVAVMRRDLEDYVSYPGGEFLGLVRMRWAEPEESGSA